MYLLASAVAFLLASAFRKIRYECLIVSFVAFTTFMLQSLMSWDGIALYWLRAAITTAGAIALCGCRSFFGFYQAAIYGLVMGVYALLAYDVAAYNHWLANGGIEPVSFVWGETYKGLIHGLVLCQLAGFIPIVWSAVSSRLSIRNNSVADLLWGKGGQR